MSDKDQESKTTAFQALFKHVKPLKQNKANLRQALGKIIPRDPLETSEPVPSVTSADKLFYKKRNLPQKLLRQLKKGQYNLEDTIDLHGMTVVEAKRELDQFIADSFASNFFIIGVVHGKGRSNFEEPILKNKVNAWLRNYPEVITFCSATPKDGGIGKVYVMLEEN